MGDDTKAVLLLDETTKAVSPSGEVKDVVRRAYKILRPQGQEYGTVRVYFDSATRLEYLRAWSITSQGAEYEVKDKDKEMVETTAFPEALYEDTRVRHVQIPASLPGSIIAYEYARSSRPRILQSLWIFQHDIPTMRARMTLELPPNWEFETYWRNYPAAQAVPTASRCVTWELNEVEALPEEDHMPPRRALAGSLGLSFHPADAGRSSWRQVGSWYASLAAERLKPTPEIKAKVSALLATSAPTFRDKLNAIADFVQQDVRYVAIEIGIGTLQPHHPEEVFRNLYGDCKDKATLLSVMLREAGFDSYYVLVNTDRGAVNPDFPSVMGFNHVINAIRLPKELSTDNLYAVRDHAGLGRLLFFDSTDSLNPLGYLPSSLQGGDGLLITSSGGELVRLPLVPPTVNRFLRGANLTIGADGSLSGTVREIRSGSLAILKKAAWRSMSKTEQKRNLEDFVTASLGHATVSEPKVEGLSEISGSLVIDYGVAALTYAQPAGPLLLFRPRVLGTQKSDILETSSRKNPLEFADNFSYGDVFEIRTPPGYVVDELPTGLTVRFSAVEYESKFETGPGLLRYTRAFTIKQPRIPKEELDQMRRLYRQIASEEESMVVLKKAEP